MKKKSYTNIVKVLNYIFPIIIGGICSSLGTWLNIEAKNIVQIALIVIFSITFSAMLYYDTKREIELDEIIKYSSHTIKFLTMKNIVIQLFAILAGALCSSLGDWDRKQAGFDIKVIIIIIVAIIYIIFVVVSVKIDDKLNKQREGMLRKIQQINSIYESTIESISYVSRLMMGALKKQKRDISVNVAEEIASLLCHGLERIIEKYDSADFYITYSKRYDKQYIKTIAWAGKCAQGIPYEFKQARQINRDRHMDSMIMKNKEQRMILHYNQEEIKNRFYYEHKRDIEYKRYFAIPIWSEREIRGIFQIVYYTESKFLDEENIAEIFSTKILPQYVSIARMINELYEDILNIQENK